MVKGQERNINLFVKLERAEGSSSPQSLVFSIKVSPARAYKALEMLADNGNQKATDLKKLLDNAKGQMMGKSDEEKDVLTALEDKELSNLLLTELFRNASLHIELEWDGKRKLGKSNIEEVKDGEFKLSLFTFNK